MPTVGDLEPNDLPGLTFCNNLCRLDWYHRFWVMIGEKFYEFTKPTAKELHEALPFDPERVYDRGFIAHLAHDLRRFTPGDKFDA